MNTVESERMRARRLQPEDIDLLQSFHEDPQVMETLGGVKSEEENRKWLEKNLGYWEKDGFGIWLLFDKETDEFLGRGGLRRTIVDGKEEIELAYSLLPKFWGKGLATELALSVLDIAKKLDLPDVIAFTLPDNTRSRRVMEKAGFTYERDFVWEDEGLCVLYRKKIN